MYQGKGPHRIFADLVSDDDLRSDALILEGVARPIETMCWTDVQAQRDPDNWIDFAVSRCATGSADTPHYHDGWWGAVAETLMSRHDQTLLKRLRLTGACNPPANPLSEWVQQEVRTLTKVCKFSDALASRITWAQLIFWYTLPHAADFLASPDSTKRHQCMPHLKLIVSTLLKAQDAWLGGNRRVEPSLKLIGWDREPLCIEIMALLVQGP